ncbi:APE4-like protein [Lachancea thermotolerans]
MLRLQLRKACAMSDHKANYPHEFVKFLNACPTPYHAVHEIKKHFDEYGFKELSERHSWDSVLTRGGGFYVTRNDSSILAFTVGCQWAPGNPIAITGAHTDSPVLKIKPVSKRSSEGYAQVGVECYGGGIWHSWFDADLSIAGRVMVKDQKTSNVRSMLVDLKQPLLKIPTLAIHLDRDVNQKFEFDRENQLLPVAGLESQSSESSKSCEQAAPQEGEFFSIKAVVERHHRDLVDLVAEELGIEVTQIEDFELTLYDHKPACLGGLHREFVFSGRLDNLTSCFTSMHGLTEALKTGLEKECGIRMMVCFDHEEIGSSSAQGADSNFLPAILERILRFPAISDKSGSQHDSSLQMSVARSFFLSSDVAHAVHPNYANKYESKHKPAIGQGPVIKINANQRYMTNSPGLVLVKHIAERAKVPLQLFVVANNSPCGSTIGPIIASKTGIKTLDLGNPILSMHSIRETGGSDDLEWQIKLFCEFFETYSTYESKVYEPSA